MDNIMEPIKKGSELVIIPKQVQRKSPEALLTANKRIKLRNIKLSKQNSTCFLKECDTQYPHMLMSDWKYLQRYGETSSFFHAVLMDMYLICTDCYKGIMSASLNKNKEFCITDFLNTDDDPEKLWGKYRSAILVMEKRIEMSNNFFISWSYLQSINLQDDKNK